MKDKRVILYMALVFVGMMLWTKWSVEHSAKVAANETNQSHVSSLDSGLPPQSALKSVEKADSSDVPDIKHQEKIPATRVVKISTDVLNLSIDKKGGNIISASLPKYSKSLNDESPIQILSEVPDNLYVAQNGLMGEKGPDTQEGQATYTTTKDSYQLEEGKNDLVVDLSWEKNGIKITKSFVFTRGKYDVDVKYTIHNNSGQDWVGSDYSQIRYKQQATQSGMFGLNTYTGPAISTKDHPYEKIKTSRMDSKSLDQTSEGGWVSMQQRYFVTAWVPPQKQKNHFFSQKSGSDVYTLGYVGPQISVPAKETHTAQTRFYVGPELQDILESIAPHLGLTIDYGWLWWAAEPIFYVMSKINSIVGNWGWSIVLVTLLIKLLFYKFSEASYRSMAKMKKLQPRIEQLKKNFGDDKTKLNKAVMEMYQQEKVNPLGGCLPMVIQIPIFIALYYVLIESVQLRQAPFIFWIQDLSVKDPFYVLPVLMGISMFVQQMINPPQVDKTQEMMMKYGLPALFTFLFLNFPAGLTLYWFVNNVLSIAQQEYVMHKFNLKQKKPHKIAKSKK